MRGFGDDFMVSLRDFMIWMGTLLFSVAVDGMVVVGYEEVGAGLLDFGIMVLELDYSFGGLYNIHIIHIFCLELGCVKE